MSHKGAIKKTTDLKSVSKPRLSLKTKSKSSSDGISEVLSPTDSKDVKISHTREREQRAAGDRQQKSLQNTSSKLGTGSRVSSKDKLVASQTKSVRQSGASLKHGVINSPRYKEQSANNRIQTNDVKTKRQKTEEKRSKNVSAVSEQSISKDKSGSGYSEKRGKSSIYLPKTARSSNSVTSRISSQPVGQKQVPTSRNERQKIGRTDIIDKTAKDKTATRRSSRERRRSRTLSPSEVKVLHSALRNNEILNDGKHKKENNGKTCDIVSNTEADDYEYEDDFEDYESDFQECTDSEVSQISEERDDTATPEPEPIEMQREEQIKTINSANGRGKSDEESMLDSGHYELAEARKRAARIEHMSLNYQKTPALPELKQPVNRAYRQEKTAENKSQPLSSTDEGFEDGRSGDFTKSPPISQISFVEFQKPKQRTAEKKLAPKSRRGEELLSMIKLDTVEWSLIEYTPIAYEDFIQNYGRLNTQQISVQTNEDNLEVETQTEFVERNNKWTQFPITCRNILKSSQDVKLFKMEQIGVGEDAESESSSSPSLPTYDVVHLNEFLSRAGRVMLSLLEERKVGGNVLRSDSHELPFSEGFIKLDVDSVSFLTDRKVSFIHYCEALNRILLTIHVPNNDGIETTSKQEYLTDCCIGCVWSISEPSRPIKLFYSCCAITACCFHSTNYNVVFAGLQDGSINLWDLREDEMWHQKVTDKVNEVDWILRSPTYTTADSIDENHHNSAIVAVRIISHIDEDISIETNDRLAPIQICTLDEDGELIVWSVLYTMGIRVDDLGLAPWGDTRLRKSQRIVLDAKKDKTNKSSIAYFDMGVDCVDSNNLFLANNSNNILHATCIGNKVAPNYYKGCETECFGATRCVEGCPFKQSYFLVGCDDGTVRLHSLKVERSLLQLSHEECSNAAMSLQWSKSKPFTIFVLDSASKIHIWNLSDSDMFPVYTISTKKWGCVTSMQLSPCKDDRDMLNQYLAFGTDNGKVEIHKLKKEFCYNRRHDSDQELETFLRYVDIL